MSTTTTTHTPGPWAVELPSGYPCSAKSNILKPDGTILARIDYGIGETEQANARLIAAAPELLEALRALHEYTRVASAGYRNALTQPEDELYTQVHTLIAKATQP
jgi:hypothetical protein